MHEVKLVYPTYKQHEPSLTYKEALTHSASVDLFLLGIHTSQTSATRLAFESERDMLLGLLYLSGNDKFTPVCVQKDSSFK